jgi:hypothetical protein
MTFKVGDKVKFLNEVGGGTITRIRQQTAFVETIDGFEIPALFSVLIKVDDAGFGGMKPEISVASTSPKTPSSVKPVLEEEDFLEEEDDEDEGVITSENCTLNILLGLVPVSFRSDHNGKKTGTSFEVFLISDCDYRMLYTFSIVKENFVRGRKAGLVEEDTKVSVATFSVEELKDIQSFKINCIFYKKGIYLPHEPVIYEYRIDALSLVDPVNWKENDYFEEKAILVNITEMSLLYEIERMVSETDDKYIIQKKRRDLAPKKSPAKSQSFQSDTEEIDLHIDELMDDHTGMSAGEILDMQLSRFNIALEGAIRGKTKKIIFIHGIGNGKLKYEITKILDRKYPKLHYQDASFKEYGYGATMVMIR